MTHFKAPLIAILILLSTTISYYADASKHHHKHNHSIIGSAGRTHHSHHRERTRLHSHAHDKQPSRVSSDVDDTKPQTAEEVKPYLTGEYPHPHSQFTCLMDVNSGQVLFGNNIDKQHPPASLTKIMAATVLLENGKLNDTVIAPPDVKGVPESSLHLRPGEKISLNDLLYAMLLRSANDTPVAGAFYLSGSISKFVDLMNQKAESEGCLNTHFVTPNGLYDPQHYSTAHDLAIMARYAILHLPKFDDIVRTQEFRVNRSVDKKDTLVINTARSFLKFFPGADGIKTGFVSQAGHCFVGSATRNGYRLIAVALDSSQCREDVESMLSYGFKEFSPVVAVPKGQAVGSIKIGPNNISLPVANAIDLKAVRLSGAHTADNSYHTIFLPRELNQIRLPIRSGTVVGTVQIVQNGRVISSGDAIATKAVSLIQPVSFNNTMILLSKTGKIAGIVTGSLIAIVAIFGYIAKIYGRASAENRRRRRARLATQGRGVD